MRWTKKEEDELVKLYPFKSSKELSEILNRSEESVRWKSSQLRLRKNKPWTDEEDIFIKKNINNMSDKELSDELGRSLKSISGRMTRLKLKRNNDLSGNIYGRLTVIRPTKKRSGSKIMWECLCTCGSKKLIQTDSLTGGKTKSCGCIQRETVAKNGRERKSDYLGKVFGKLTVLEDTGERRSRQILWRCLCECGNEKLAVSYYLRKGVTRSCGLGSCHNAYNHSLTDEDRMKNRDVTENLHWRKKVFERDRYMCTMCGDDKGGNLNAHHLNGWHTFPKERFDINNGVTLCSSCHRQFHKQYGYGNNTEKQFYEFKKKMAVLK